MMNVCSQVHVLLINFPVQFKTSNENRINLSSTHLNCPSAGSGVERPPPASLQSPSPTKSLPAELRLYCHLVGGMWAEESRLPLSEQPWQGK